MDTLQLVVLAIIQGVTEFLPVSSSAHLILLPLLTDWSDQGLSIDVACHLGTLIAVIVYFRKDLMAIVKSVLNPYNHTPKYIQNRLLFQYVCIATVPTLAIGFFGADLISTYLRSPLIIAIASIVFGIVLLGADKKGQKNRALVSLTIKDAIIIGLAQVLALIPGTSRAGITITAGLALGLNRDSATRFSFLLAIPIIAAASGYQGLKLFMQTGSYSQLRDMLIVAILSACCATLTIHAFLKFLDKVGMLPFVIYRVGLGIFLLIVFS